MSDLVEFEINRVPTKYRESTKYLGLLRNYLGQIAPLVETARSIPTFFDLDDAVGEQLTFIGRQMGFPRPHPAGQLRQFFGFPGPSAFPVEGWSIGEWKNGPLTEAASMGDDLYRRFLKTLVYRIEQRRSSADLLDAVKLLIGPTAYLLTSKAGTIKLATGRTLTEEERRRVHLFSEVLPISPGMVLEVYEVEKAFGFGEGWGGWSEGHWPLRVW